MMRAIPSEVRHKAEPRVAMLQAPHAFGTTPAKIGRRTAAFGDTFRSAIAKNCSLYNLYLFIV